MREELVNARGHPKYVKETQTIPRAGLDGTQIKYIAALTMFLDHFAGTFLSPATNLYWSLRFVGRMSFVLYCFLLVEGFMHTSDQKRYLEKIGLFALISEIPFDIRKGLHISLFAKSNLFNIITVGFQNGQNVFFTLFLGLLALSIFPQIRETNLSRTKALVKIVIIICVADMLKTDYGGIGIILILLMYILRAYPLHRTVFGLILLISNYGILYLSSIGSFAMMQIYNGKRGNNRFKNVFYWIYPIHLTLFGVIKTILNCLSK